MALGADPAVEAAGEALRAALAPAAQQLAMDLAQQAAVEVSGQLGDSEVDVVLRDGEPVLAVRRGAEPPPSIEEEMDARLTLRLPPSVKQRVEQAAASVGDSVNSWVVKTLSTTANQPSQAGRRVTGRVRT